MKINLRFLLIQSLGLSLAFWLLGCSSRYYMPTLQNVPNFKGKGDLTINGTCSMTDQINGSTSAPAIEMQAGYAITDHVAIIGGGTKVLLEENKGHMVDAGIGFYSGVPNDPKNSMGLYVGGSFGRVFPEDFISYTQNSEYKVQQIDYNLKRIFIQPVLNINFTRIELAASARFVYLNISVSDDVASKLNGVDGFDPSLMNLPYYVGASNHYFLEPAFTFRVGIEKVKLHFQTAFAFQLGQEELPSNELNFNAGLSFRLPLKKQSETTDF